MKKQEDLINKSEEKNFLLQSSPESSPESSLDTSADKHAHESFAKKHLNILAVAKPSALSSGLVFCSGNLNEGVK